MGWAPTEYFLLTETPFSHSTTKVQSSRNRGKIATDPHAHIVRLKSLKQSLWLRKGLSEGSTKESSSPIYFVDNFCTHVSTLCGQLSIPGIFETVGRTPASGFPLLAVFVSLLPFLALSRSIPLNIVRACTAKAVLLQVETQKVVKQSRENAVYFSHIPNHLTHGIKLTAGQLQKTSIMMVTFFLDFCSRLS